jgi:predicted DNA-binding antitoxin AbrB/MazE fold protein
MKTFHAIYENGVFRPTEPVDLPEGSEVTVETKHDVEPSELSHHQKRIYELLSQSRDTEDPHFSERHNEHQP